MFISNGTSVSILSGDFWATPIARRTHKTLGDDFTNIRSISLDSEHSKAAASSVRWNEKECDKMVDIFVDRCMNSAIAQEKNWKKIK